MVRFFFLLLLGTSVYSENNNISDMLDNVLLERQLINNLRLYTKELEEKLIVIKGALAEYSQYVNEAESHRDLYLSNQLYTFKLKRHLSLDWAALQVYMENEVGSEQIDTQRHLVVRTPKVTEYKEEALKLQTILQFYHLESNTFLAGNNSHLILSPVDYYHMGVELYRKEMYHEAADWLSVAVNNYTTSPHCDLLGVPKWRVYSIQSKVYVKLKMWVEAQDALKRAISLEPQNVNLLKQKKQMAALDTQRDSRPLSPPAAIVTDLQQICKGAFQYDTQLLCEISSDVTPFLKIAPLHVEEVLIDPYTMIYKKAIYESEIIHIKQIYEQCSPNNKIKGDDGIRGCLISDSHSDVTMKISTRFMDMTGINNALDGLFILEYGQINAFQLFKQSMFRNKPLDDNLATAIVFLNDIMFGGAIALPTHKVAVFPRQGEALVTFDGYLDHTVCPNIVGNGLVIVKLLNFEEEEE